MYLANPAHLPSWIVLPVLLILYVLGGPLTFLITVRLMKEPKTWPLRTLTVSLFGFLAATVLLGFDRLTTVAYYETYNHQLGALSLFSSALLLPVILSACAVGGVLYLSLRHVRRHLQMLDDLPSTRLSTSTEYTAPPSFMREPVR